MNLPRHLSSTRIRWTRSESDAASPDAGCTGGRPGGRCGATDDSQLERVAGPAGPRLPQVLISIDIQCYLGWMAPTRTPLFVRLPKDQAAALDRLADSTGRHKQHLISELLADRLTT